MITLVNYGLGNIQAFVNIYRRLNVPVTVADTADELSRAQKIILPGVGSFDWAMTRLNESGMRPCLDEVVVEKKRPVLGVCVGMQMMAWRSEEGSLDGLRWVNAEVRKFDEAKFAQKVRLPHMGWNDVVPRSSECLFNGIEDAPRFYFLHSYYMSLKNPDEVLAVTDYSGPFVSAVRSGNVFGTQFHPEKSHHWGIQVLKNFAEL